MKKILATAALAVAPLALASEDAMNAALNSWNQQMAEYTEAIKNAPSDEVRASIPAPDARRVAPRIWQSINGRTGTRPNPKGRGRVPSFEFEQSWALPAIVWILNNQQAFTAAFNEDEQDQLNYFSTAIIESLHNNHFSNPAAGAVAPGISASSNVRDYELLQKIYLRNQNKEARAAAALGMSLMLNNPMISSVEGSDSMARAKRLYYLKQSILLGGKEGRFGSQLITEVAMEQAYFLRHLSTGAIAPLIHVLDSQDARCAFPTPGKLTLLLFWSPDAPASVALMQDAAKLKSQYPGLEICPIMPNRTPEERQQVLQSLSVADSYMDDADGSAMKTYRIGMLPSVLLISERCTILYGGAPDMKLQAALEAATGHKQNANPEKRPSVRVEYDDKPAIQPGFTPEPSDGEVPGLREMPEF